MFLRILDRRVRLCLAGTLLFVLSVFYFLHNNINKNNSGSANGQARPKSLPKNGHGHDQQVAVVVAGLRSSNTKWLSDAFPHWDKHIYIADDELSRLRIPKNKGREAMVYLTSVGKNRTRKSFALVYLINFMCLHQIHGRPLRRLQQ